MSIEHYLETEIGAGRAATDDLIQIDQHAPKGFYRNAKGECLLVCDDPDRRFMVILHHGEYKPFTAIDLGDIPFGEWSFRSRLVWQFLGGEPHEGDLELGEAQLLETSVKLVMRDLHGSFVMKAVSHGYGTFYDDWHNYQSWHLLTGGKIIFSKQGPVA